MFDVSTGWLAALMGVVEGITEYLPISSTGHLVLAEKWLGTSFHESFEVVIQSGAMLAVLVEYRRRFLRLADFRARAGFAGGRGLLWLFLTTLPAMVGGLLFHDAIKAKLFAPGPIAIALARVDDVARYGAVEVDGNKVAGFREKGPAGPGWINAGCYFLGAGALADLPARTAYSFETAFLQPRVQSGDVAAFIGTAGFIDIGVPEDYRRAQSLFGQGDTP